MDPSLRATLVLQRLSNLGVGRYGRLLETFGSPRAILAAPLDQLQPLLGETALTQLTTFRRDPTGSDLGRALERDSRWLKDHPEVQTLTLDHPNYPQLLREIHRPPPLLYLLGDAAVLNLPQIGIVGSRNPTAGGRDNSHSFARYLAENGFAITSGLATGVDGAAHSGALAGQGKTIAVLGTGIDRVYPTRHRSLVEQILNAGGALVSEFPPGTGPQAGNFPQRNRVISGLSCGVLVVEAALRSGSLITARFALAQNREVFAIPGSIHNPLARGCHRLIQQGAKLVETAADIVEELGALLDYKRAEAVQTPDIVDTELTREEQLLLESLGFDPVDPEELSRRSRLPIGAVAAHLINLELKGRVRREGAGYQRLEFGRRLR